MRAAGRSMGAIARALGRAKTTISRELQRNALPLGGYSPLHAAGAYQLRRRREAILEREAALRLFVGDRLAVGGSGQHRTSPGRTRARRPMRRACGTLVAADAAPAQIRARRPQGINLQFLVIVLILARAAPPSRLKPGAPCRRAVRTRLENRAPDRREAISILLPGHIETMAYALAEGARGAGATVDVKRVPENVPEAVAKAAHFKLDQPAPIATPDELPNYDAIAVGAPTRFGRMPSAMGSFWERAGQLWMSGALHGKVGGAARSANHPAVRRAPAGAGDCQAGRRQPADGVALAAALRRGRH